ncbi:hypothetical protein BDV06DRAFT_231528 [Aspergillus oleicola]
MSSSPKGNYRTEIRGDKQERVQRACDRCNNSRTRLCPPPWYLPLLTQPELNYACQYKRTVKKRGPKPRSSQSGHANKGCLTAGPIHRAHPSLGWGSSRDSPSRGEKLSIYTTSDCDTITTDSQSSAGGLDISCSFDLNLFSGVGFSHSHSVRSPGYHQFPLDLDPVACSNGGQIDITTCRYPCLNPVLPLLRGTMGPEDAYTPGTSDRCPYVLSPVIRAESLLRQENTRSVSPALLTIILWCVSHTAELDIFRETSARTRATQCLYFLSMKLLRARESDHWNHRQASGWASDSDTPLFATTVSGFCANNTRRSDHNVDDVLSYVLLTCVISGTKFREDCLKWWNKAVLLVKMLGLNSEARIAEQTPYSQQMSLAAREDHEERRRIFWLVYALDRHFALLFHEPLHIHDFEGQVLYPLPEWIWRNLDKIPLDDIPPRFCGPPTQVTGTGFFEHFLPTMTILGGVLELRSRNQHPRLGGLNEIHMASTVETMLADFEYGLEMLQAIRTPVQPVLPGETSLMLPESPASFGCLLEGQEEACGQQQADIVTAYSRYMVRILRLLLYKRTDSASMVENIPECTFTPQLLSCDSNSILIGDSIAHILEVDNELEFMPFVFGIYLFHGSISFLSQIDQLSRFRVQDLTRQGFEAIVRANEIAVRSLDTSFQRHFARVVRQYTCAVGSLSSSIVRAQDGDIWSANVDAANNLYL